MERHKIDKKGANEKNLEHSCYYCSMGFLYDISNCNKYNYLISSLLQSKAALWLKQ